MPWQKLAAPLTPPTIGHSPVADPPTFQVRPFPPRNVAVLECFIRLELIHTYSLRAAILPFFPIEVDIGKGLSTGAGPRL